MTNSLERDSNLSTEVREATGVNADLCMQCFRCSSGCPMAEEYDILPHQIMRQIQEGDVNVRTAKAMWLCASCQTCNTRCPMEIDIPAAIDYFRQQSVDDAAVPEVARFYKTFMKNAKRFGRIYEMGLMGELNMRDGKPFRDLSMGLRMMSKGKLKLMPRFISQPTSVKERDVKEYQVAYYPGCSLHSTGKAFDRSFRGVAQALDLELVEIPGWTCCGATPAHATDAEGAVSMPISNLALAERAGFKKVASPCAACYSRFKSAQRHYREEPELAAEIDLKIDYPFGDSVEVWHATQCIDEMAGEKFEQRVKQSLDGLKVACYYGCLLTRPPNDTGAGEAENPDFMENIIRSAGGQVIDWGRKTDCCGGSLGVTHTELAKQMTADIIKEAKVRGADMVAVACPLCQVNLDERQPEMAQDLGFTIPVLYITQIMAYALGLSDKDQALSLSAVAPAALTGS